MMLARLSMWLLLSLILSVAWAEQSDVILLLDTSQTMKRVDPQGLASSAVAGAIERLRGDVRAGVVLFRSVCHPFCPAHCNHSRVPTRAS